LTHRQPVIWIPGKSPGLPQSQRKRKNKKTKKKKTANDPGKKKRKAEERQRDKKKSALGFRTQVRRGFCKKGPGTRWSGTMSPNRFQPFMKVCSALAAHRIVYIRHVKSGSRIVRSKVPARYIGTLGNRARMSRQLATAQRSGAWHHRNGQHFDGNAASKRTRVSSGAGRGVPSTMAYFLFTFAAWPNGETERRQAAISKSSCLGMCK